MGAEFDQWYKAMKEGQRRLTEAQSKLKTMRARAVDLKLDDTVRALTEVIKLLED